MGRSFQSELYKELAQARLQFEVAFFDGRVGKYVIVSEFCSLLRNIVILLELYAMQPLLPNRLQERSCTLAQ